MCGEVGMVRMGPGAPLVDLLRACALTCGLCNPALGPGLKVRRLTPEAAATGAREGATDTAARRDRRMGG